MKPFFGMSLLKVFALTCGIGLVAGMLARPARADEWNKKTILTVYQPTQVTGRVLLEPGQYVFKLLNSSSDRHIVQIFNRDETHIINTVLAVPAYRMEPTGRTVFTFWETPAGYAKAMRDWYYPGDNYGQEFSYPKQLAMLETQAAAPAPAPQAAPPEPETPAPQPQAEREETPQPEQPAEIAQATPPAAPPEQTAPPATESTPKNLPKTATPYPAIGLAGLIALCAFGLLRLRRIV